MLDTVKITKPVRLTFSPLTDLPRYPKNNHYYNEERHKYSFIFHIYFIIWANKLSWLLILHYGWGSWWLVIKNWNTK